jgi:isocitrate/isopropylmalate dehydrogenase
VYLQGKGLEDLFDTLWKGESKKSKEESTPLTPSEFIRDVILKLRKNPDAFIFLEPVDPKVLPDYHLKIKNPIDLKTMLEKLDREFYSEERMIEEFEQDFSLMIENCYTYNAKGSFGYNCGIAVSKYFEKLMKKRPKT